MSQRLTRSEVEERIRLLRATDETLQMTRDLEGGVGMRALRALLAAWDALEEYQACADPVGCEVSDARWDRCYKQARAALPAPEVKP